MYGKVPPRRDSERGRSSTVIWIRYCGTAAKAGGKQRKQTWPYVTEVSCLLEICALYTKGFHTLHFWGMQLIADYILSKASGIVR